MSRGLKLVEDLKNLKSHFPSFLEKMEKEQQKASLDLNLEKLFESMSNLWNERVGKVQEKMNILPIEEMPDELWDRFATIIARLTKERTGIRNSTEAARAIIKKLEGKKELVEVWSAQIFRSFDDLDQWVKDLELFVNPWQSLPIDEISAIRELIMNKDNYIPEMHAIKEILNKYKDIKLSPKEYIEIHQLYNEAVEKKSKREYTDISIEVKGIEKILKKNISIKEKFSRKAGSMIDKFNYKDLGMKKTSSIRR